MKDTNKLYWLKSGSYSLILNILQQLFGFGSFYFLVRMLDKESFGIWILFLATTTIFETARGGMIQNALIKFLSESPVEEKPKIISASFVLTGILMGVCIIVNLSIAGYLSRLWHYPGLVQMFILYNGVYILQGFLSQFQWIEQAYLRFQGIMITTMIRQGGFFLYILINFIFDFHISLLSLIYVQAVFTGMAAMVEYFYVRNFLVISYHWHAAWVRKIFSYGKFVFGTSMSAIVSNTLNQMMLGTMISVDAAGSYNVAMRIFMLSDIPNNALGAIVFPQSAKRFATQGIDAGKYLYEKSVGTILAILIPPAIFVFCFPSFVVRVIAGVHYGESAHMVQLLILTCLLGPYERFFGVIMDSIGKAKLNFMMILGVTVTIFTLNYFLIGRYGIMGCIYGTLTADIIIFVIRQILIYKILHVNALNPLIYAYRFYPEFFRNYVKPLLGKLPD
jgi:lipopolysaccharide exporter